MRCLYQNAINRCGVRYLRAHFAPAECDNIGKEMVACMKGADDRKKKLEDVTEVQMKYQKEIEAIVRGMSSPKVMP